MNLVILGPQGAGKGTQAKLLAKEFNLPNFSVGALFRSEVKKKTAIGKKIENIINKGKLVPIEIAEKVVKNEVKKSKYKKGFIVDGFPRELAQAKFFAKLVNIDYVILITLPEKETIKRLSCRRVCPVCGETYNICAKKPQTKNYCNKDHAKLVRRKDDYPSAIRQRLKIYHKKNKPVINFYAKKNKVIKIDGKGTITQVHNRIINKLKKRIKNDNL